MAEAPEMEMVDVENNEHPLFGRVDDQLNQGARRTEPVRDRAPSNSRNGSVPPTPPSNSEAELFQTNVNEHDAEPNLTLGDGTVAPDTRNPLRRILQPLPTSILEKEEKAQTVDLAREISLSRNAHIALNAADSSATHHDVRQIDAAQALVEISNIINSVPPTNSSGAAGISLQGQHRTVIGRVRSRAQTGPRTVAQPTAAIGGGSPDPNRVPWHPGMRLRARKFLAAVHWLVLAALLIVLIGQKLGIVPGPERTCGVCGRTDPIEVNIQPELDRFERYLLRLLPEEAQITHVLTKQRELYHELLAGARAIFEELTDELADGVSSKWDTFSAHILGSFEEIHQSNVTQEDA